MPQTFFHNSLYSQKYDSICLIPCHCVPVVEASHANAYARAIAFFSYIWVKYDILSLQCCKLGGIVVSRLSSQTSAFGFDLQMDCASCDAVCRNLEGDVHSYLFLLQNLALQLGLGQRCQPEGITIT